MLSRYFYSIFFILLFSQTLFANNNSMTKWKLVPSFKYDMCCFLNILTGDPYYREHYPDEPNPYENKLTPKVKQAVDSLFKKLKTDNNIIISAWLCLYFSAIEGEEIYDLIGAVKNPGPLKENFSKTTYYNDESWDIFLSIKEELLVIFEFLKQNDFKKYWNENILPRIEKRINIEKAGIDKYDVIAQNELMLGAKLPSDTITVYMLYYNRPHGIKITGMRFITSIQWPFEITIRTSAHEMMHPPYDYKNDEELRSVIESFRSDEFLMDKVNNHNKSLGYNDLEGLFEEDCVQSMDQIISERLGVSVDARKRWQESDEGIHVLAIALYQIMKEENYGTGSERFRDFLIRTVRSGKLSPGGIKEYYDRFCQ